MSTYEQRKDAINERQKEVARKARDIGPLPPIANPARRAECAENAERFLKLYLADKFPLPWSQVHLGMISALEERVLRGGLRAYAAPRGTGKTSITEAIVLWAALYGHRKFVVLIGATKEAALESRDSILMQLEENELLAQDFPEACLPIRALEGIAQRAAGLLCQGEQTHCDIAGSVLILPTIRHSVSSGAIIRCCGITGRLRGMKHERAQGSVRPDFVVLDDPQTDQSARSSVMTAKREATIEKSVLYLAGPGRKIAAGMACTVIEPGDLADRYLDHAIHPEWSGERTKFLLSPPSNLSLWERYQELRCADHVAGTRTAVEFYRSNRQAMDEGAETSWPERFDEDELSAIQHAMNRRLQNLIAFEAEYQNDPKAAIAASDSRLTPSIVGAQLNGLAQGLCPQWTTRLTMFVDIQQRVLYYAIVAWDPHFTGAVIDYGTHPRQQAGPFTALNPPKTLESAYRGKGIEAGILAGLEALVDEVVNVRYVREDGLELQIERCLIDANWHRSRDVVYQLAKHSPLHQVLVPSHGRGIGVSSKPLTAAARKPGETVGMQWRWSASKPGEIRHVVLDTNFWKSFVYARLKTALGDPGSLTLWGRSAETHRFFIEHLCSEYRLTPTLDGRSVDEWKLLPGAENHWWDCVVGAAVAASMQGCSLVGEQPQGLQRTRRTVAVPSHLKRRK